jgi:hypothetical protein
MYKIKCHAGGRFCRRYYHSKNPPAENENDNLCPECSTWLSEIASKKRKENYELSNNPAK